MKRDFHERLEIVLPTNDLKNSMIITLFGMCSEILQWLPKVMDIEKMPGNVKYACANISGNLKMFLEYDEKFSVIDLSEFENGEQTEEIMYRKFIIIIKNLYDSLSDEEKR